jgi:hypothetical protein
MIQLSGIHATWSGLIHIIIVNMSQHKRAVCSHDNWCARYENHEYSVDFIDMVHTTGVGKSHTTNCIIEGCMIPSLDNSVVLSQPMITFVAHFDTNPESICEAVTLSKSVLGNGDVVKNVVVLTSPTFYLQRKESYKVLSCLGS